MERERETLLVVAGRAELGTRLRAEGYRVIVARAAEDVEGILGGLAVDALVVGEDGEHRCSVGRRATGLPVVFIGGAQDLACPSVAAQLAAWALGASLA